MTRKVLAVLLVVAVVFGMALFHTSGDVPKALVLFAAWGLALAVVAGLGQLVIWLWYGGRS